MLLLTQVLFILLVAGILYVIHRGLEEVLKQNEVEPAHINKVLKFTMAAIAGWLALLALLSTFGIFTNFDTIPPAVGVAAVIPTVFAIYLMCTKWFTDFLATVPKHWLVYVQSFRILMELILWLGFLANTIPFQMTFVGFNYDIIVGITALMGGQLFFRKSYKKFEVFIWNCAGIFLLAFVFFIAIISSPSPYRIFNNEPSSEFVAYLPFIWLPGFVVPFAFAMHFFSIRQLFIKSD